MTSNSKTNYINTAINWPLVLRGIFLIVLGSGLFWINSQKTVNVSLLAIPALLAGIFGLIFLNKNKVDKVTKNWISIESIGDIILSLTFLYMYINGKNDITNVRDVFAGFAILFAFMQFTYMFQVAQMGAPANYKVFLIRGLTAIGYGLFGVVLFMQTGSDSLSFLLNCIGVGPILAGIGSILLIIYTFQKRD